MKFAKWMTSPERAAQWGIDTGYVAVRPDAWDTPAMKNYVAGFPAAAVARDQLQYAVAELSTHDNQRVTKALNDGLQAALTGSKTPEQAMKDRRPRPSACSSRIGDWAVILRVERRCPDLFSSPAGGDRSIRPHTKQMCRMSDRVLTPWSDDSGRPAPGSPDQAGRTSRGRHYEASRAR